MSDNKEAELLELIKKLGIDTTCEISFKMERTGDHPTIRLNGAKASLCAGLEALMITSMETIETDVKERLNLLSRIYMNAKEEIIRSDKQDEEIEEAD